jgi:phosphate transport system protein
MVELRKKFHEELAALEAEVDELGLGAAEAVRLAVDGLIHRDRGQLDRVIAGDDPIDERYMDIERRIFDCLATQTPVASDLRLLSALTHINFHLERVGDQAVNIAKIAEATANLPPQDTILVRLQEMADVVVRMLRTAIDSFSRRDLDLALKLPVMDDPVDDLNRGMYRQVVALAADPAALEWGIQMNVVARALERVGDNAVDIGEQVAFLLTGEFQEFTDASHPDAPPPTT